MGNLLNLIGVEHSAPLRSKLRVRENEKANTSTASRIRGNNLL